MKSLFKEKTTWAGVATLIMSIGAYQTGDMAGFSAALASGLGLIFAADRGRVNATQGDGGVQ